MSNVKKSKRCQKVQKMSKSPKDVKKSKRCQEVQKMSRSPKDVKKSKRCQKVQKISIAQKMSKMSQLMSEPHCIKLKFYESILEYSTGFEQMLSQSCILPIIVISCITPSPTNCREKFLLVDNIGI